MLFSPVFAVEAGRMTMEEITYSIRTAVFGVLKTLAVKASQNKLDLMYKMDPAIPDFIVGDPFRLRQVITNLVGNAGQSQDQLDCVFRRSLTPSYTMRCFHSQIHDQGPGGAIMSTCRSRRGGQLHS